MFELYNDFKNTNPHVSQRADCFLPVKKLIFLLRCRA